MSYQWKKKMSFWEEGDTPNKRGDVWRGGSVTVDTDTRRAVSAMEKVTAPVGFIAAAFAGPSTPHDSFSPSIDWLNNKNQIETRAFFKNLVLVAVQNDNQR